MQCCVANGDDDDDDDYNVSLRDKVSSRAQGQIPGVTA
jgi:hypothetical protein